MFEFCTYFDQHYFARGLALYRSLREHCPEFRLWVLCMDDTVYLTLSELKLPGVCPIALEEFERDDESLRIAKANRSRIEYYFTCTPSLPLYIFNHWPEVDLITYIDADLFFFANPAPLFEEMAGDSIAIIGHRFPPNLRRLEINGIYNVGWLSFRRDINGFACLQWWRDRCIEWCYDRTENGLFADQKYLDDWPIRFSNVVVLENKGANVAPWNISNYHLKYHVRNTIMVTDDQPLIFFHFHGLKKVNSWLYNAGLRNDGVTPSPVLRRRIYAPYIKALSDASLQLSSCYDIHAISDIMQRRPDQQGKPFAGIKHVVRQLVRLLRICKNILAGKQIIIIDLPLKKQILRKS